jgi:hypothetical protein
MSWFLINKIFILLLILLYFDNEFSSEEYLKKFTDMAENKTLRELDLKTVYNDLLIYNEF